MDDEYAGADDDSNMGEAERAMKFKEDMADLSKNAEEVRERTKAKSLRKKKLAPDAEAAGEAAAQKKIDDAQALKRASVMGMTPDEPEEKQAPKTTKTDTDQIKELDVE